MSAGDKLARSFGAATVSVDQRQQLIRRTFAQVAPRYDVMNDLMSMGIHRLWKSAFVALAAARPGEIAVDLAGGTGDIALALASAGARTLVVDPSPEMMRAGRGRPGADGLRWIAAEAERLPFPDASIDLITISFGIRNATRVDDALAEIARVLKPGGRLFCLEFSTPQAWLRPFYGLWSRTAIPLLGAIVSRRRDAYRYLVESIRRFPDQAEFASMIASSGLVDVEWRDYSFGIAAVHSARKPAA
ncbi:class I SAM-dependent methyltransferase [Bradyrhizobium sp.]|uniref:class I SAM-dependent methyltransferase n=1 Tax=Bradyrhizobium sp. TaxID=376 RepID=UPI00238FDDE7|nr:class I SAM-dependent methyltransferase [Bradyrhizobium sp.]MDE2375772.1 class I SAM-dependent methyltransferase [Bradyrhizobium sp.]